MNLVRAGRRRLNLDFLVMVEEGGPPAEGEVPADDVGAGAVRVTMALGSGFTLRGQAASELIRHLDEVAPDSAPPGTPGPAAVSIVHRHPGPKTVDPGPSEGRVEPG